MSAPARLIKRRRAVPAATVRPLKVVVTGPFSAGKTTFIKTISEVAVVGTERDVTDKTRAVKEQTTVAMDFGRITFADGLSLFLFGTPGQRRFEIMWEILSEGMIGFIVLVHATEPGSLEEAGHILETFRRYADVPHAIGVTHLDASDEPAEAAIERVRTGLAIPAAIPVMRCDPRRRKDVKNLLIEILLGVLRRLEDAGRPD